MPFRNPITTVGGILSLSELRSPDYARTDTPFNITGWRLGNNPSGIDVGSIYADNFFLSSNPGSPANHAIDVSDTLRSGPDHNYWSPVNPLNLTTSYTAFGKLTDSTGRLDIPDSCRGNDSPMMCHWQIYTSYDVRSISATVHGVLCTIATSYSSFGGWDFPFISNGEVAYLTHNYNAAADTVSTMHFLGSANNPYVETSFDMNPFAVSLYLSVAARSTVASTAVINLASTYMHITRSRLYPRLT